MKKNQTGQAGKKQTKEATVLNHVTQRSHDVCLLLQLPGDGLQNMLLTFFSSRDYYHFASLPKKYLSLKCFSPWDHFLVSLPAAETIQCNCSFVQVSCDWTKKNYVYNISVESLWREVTTRSGKHIYLNSSVILSLCFHEVSDSGIMCMWLLC